MELGFMIIFVDDLDATVRFYTEAFELAVQFTSGTFVGMSTGQTMLSFRTAADERRELGDATDFVDNRPAATPPGMQLSFVVDDVARAFDRAVAAGATPVIDPVVQPWGQTVSRVRDLNGVLIGIVSPMRA